MSRSTALGSDHGSSDLAGPSCRRHILYGGPARSLISISKTLKADSALVVHTGGDVETALEEAYSSTVKMLETGQRGYLLTGKDSYLDPYTNAAVGEMGPRLEALQRLNDRQSHAAGPSRKPETAHWGQARRAQTNDRPAPKPETGRSARRRAERSR